MLQAARLLTEFARTGDNNNSHPRGDAPEAEASTSAASTSTPSTSTSQQSNSEVRFREIHKNGWLRRTDKCDKETSRFWVAFCVHDDVEPRLEGYVDQKQATSHTPTWSQSLKTTMYLSPTLCATAKHDYEFCVNLSNDKVLRLAAPTYQAMCDWVQVVTRKLTDMKIVKPKENVYSKGPERIATRDPTSPLPPPPPLLPTTTSSTGSATTNQQRVERAPGEGASVSRQPSRSAADGVPSVFTFDETSVAEDRRARNTVLTSSQRSTASQGQHSSPRATTSDNTDNGYESVFMASSAPWPPRRDIVDASSSSSSSYGALREFSTSSTSSAAAVVALPPQPATPVTTAVSNEAARALLPPRSDPRSAQKQLTVREQQVLRLAREMSHPAGVRLPLTRRDCKESVAFVDFFDAVWVAGWKQREHPSLYNVLHIGDMIVSVAGVTPNSAAEIREIARASTATRLEVILKRLPNAKTMTLKRQEDSEDFGLELSGNEVTRVSGIACAAGVPELAPATDPLATPDATVTWTLTEVNGRPLSLLEGAARERMYAVGLDCSIVIQPTDFVTSLRKKLRSLRNYKSYVVQY